MNKKIIGMLFTLMVVGVISIAFMGLTNAVHDPPTNKWKSDLIAGGGNVKSQIKVGYLTIEQQTPTSDKMSITYSTYGGWYMSETHLAVECSLDDIPQTKKNNPIPGQFEFGKNFDPAVSSWGITIDLDDYPCITKDSSGVYRGTLFIAAHAVVEKTIVTYTVSYVDGVKVVTKNIDVQEETAWADTWGKLFNDKNWALYLEIDINPLQT
jgi:hypothetical protein